MYLKSNGQRGKKGELERITTHPDDNVSTVGRFDNIGDTQVNHYSLLREIRE